MATAVAAERAAAGMRIHVLENNLDKVRNILDATNVKLTKSTTRCARLKLNLSAANTNLEQNVEEGERRVRDYDLWII